MPSEPRNPRTAQSVPTRRTSGARGAEDVFEAARDARETRGRRRRREPGKRPRSDSGRRAESPPGAVPGVHAQPVFRPGGVRHRVVGSSRKSVELRRLLVGKQEGQKRDSGEPESEGPAPQAGAVLCGAVAESENEARRRKGNRREDEPVDDGKPVHEERDAEPHGALSAPLAQEEDESLEEQRDPAREEIVDVRHLAEAVRHESEGDPRHPRGAGRARERAAEPERPVSGEREAEERREPLHGQRADAERVEREERQRDAVVVLAEGEAVLQGKEDVPVEEAKRVVESLVEVPPHDPRVQVGIAGVRDSGRAGGEPTARS